jgi:hypothetical protein
LRAAEWGGSVVIAAVAAAGVLLVSIADRSARTQSADNPAGAINLGGRGWSVPEGKSDVPGRSTSQVEFEFRGGLGTDYMYRGTTLSDYPKTGITKKSFVAPYFRVAQPTTFWLYPRAFRSG